MTKPTTPLLDVLKAAHYFIAVRDNAIFGPKGNLVNENLLSILSQLNAHIAWRESGECVEAACIEYAARTNQAVIDYNMKAAIKAMEGEE